MWCVCVCLCVFSFFFWGWQKDERKREETLKKGTDQAGGCLQTGLFYINLPLSLSTVSVACARLSGRRNGECCPANGKPTGGGLGSIFPVIMS